MDYLRNRRRARAKNPLGRLAFGPHKQPTSTCSDEPAKNQIDAVERVIGAGSLPTREKTTRLEALYAIADDHLGISGPSVEPSKTPKRVFQQHQIGFGRLSLLHTNQGARPRCFWRRIHPNGLDWSSLEIRPVFTPCEDKGPDVSRKRISSSTSVNTSIPCLRQLSRTVR